MTLPAFLDDDDLARLTGYVKPSKQIAFLEARGIPHHVNARGRPVVRRDQSGEALATPELGPVR